MGEWTEDDLTAHDTEQHMERRRGWKLVWTAPKGVEVRGLVTYKGVVLIATSDGVYAYGPEEDVKKLCVTHTRGESNG